MQLLIFYLIFFISFNDFVKFLFYERVLFCWSAPKKAKLNQLWLSVVKQKKPVNRHFWKCAVISTSTLFIKENLFNSSVTCPMLSSTLTLSHLHKHTYESVVTRDTVAVDHCSRAAWHILLGRQWRNKSKENRPVTIYCSLVILLFYRISCGYSTVC